MSEKTTINIDRDLHKKLKIEATKREMNVGELAERLISGSLAFDAYFRMMKEECENYKGEGKNVVQYAPNLFHLLTNLYGDDRISKHGRQLIGSALGYLLIPYDVKPEAVYGAKGYIDDIFLSLHILSDLIEAEDREILKEAWSGEGNIIELVDELSEEVKELIDEDKDRILQHVGLEEK